MDVMSGGALLAVALAVGFPAAAHANLPVSEWDHDEFRTVCRYNTSLLPELSGLTPSLRHRRILWAVNDSGNAPILYALDAKTCRVRARHTLTRGLVDAEALATSRDRRGRPILWIGDIGDNARVRTRVRIIRIREPSLGVGSSRGRVLRVRYPDRPHDAESLMASKRGRWLYIGTKQAGESSLYRFSTRGPRQTGVRLRAIPNVTTDAARNPRSGDYAIRDYTRIFRFRWPARSDQAIGTSTAPPQRQAEALAFSRNGRWLYTASEQDPRLLRARVSP
jgi:hypothetical protein